MDSNAFTTLSAILGSLTGLANLATKSNDLEFNKKVIELQQFVIQLQTGVSALQAENTTLKSKIATLTKMAEIEEKLAVKGNAYWLPRGEGWDGPFCINCWDLNRQLVRMTWLHSNYYQCNVHKIGMAAS
jgi:hypothetical protein